LRNNGASVSEMRPVCTNPIYLPVLKTIDLATFLIYDNENMKLKCKIPQMRDLGRNTSYRMLVNSLDLLQS
jgi:hypothetical protein